MRRIKRDDGVKMKTEAVFGSIKRGVSKKNMEATYTTKITKIVNGERRTVEDTLVREIRLEIVVNGERIGGVMATPVDQEPLAIGYLLSEGILRDVSDIDELHLVEDGTRVELTARIDPDHLERLDSEGVVTSGCGRSRTANIDPETIEAGIITSRYTLPASRLLEEMKRFYTECPLYEETGCVHTAKLYLNDGDFFLAEDIAQHNTVDKAVGKALLAGKELSRSFLMVSGRLSSEMVAKAVMHRIPILASRTASTCLGVRIAEKFGLTLIGFVRGSRMNIYRNERRIDVS
jgi:FdhD protein